MAEVGNCQWNAELNRLLADFGRPFLVHAVVWYVLFVGILSGHKWKSHPRGCYSTHHIGCRLQHKQLLRAVLFCLLERSCYSMCMPRYVSSTFAVSSSRLQKCLKIWSFLEQWHNHLDSLRCILLLKLRAPLCAQPLSTSFLILPHLLHLYTTF